MSTIALARPEPKARPPRRAPKPKPLPNIPFATFEDIPGVFAMKLASDCLTLELMDGEEVVFTKADKPKAGDLAIFILQPEGVQEGSFQCLVKRLVLEIPPWVTFPWRENPMSEVRALAIAVQSNSPRQYMIPCEHRLAVVSFPMSSGGLRNEPAISPSGEPGFLPRPRRSGCPAQHGLIALGCGLSRRDRNSRQAGRKTDVSTRGLHQRHRPGNWAPSWRAASVTVQEGRIVPVTPGP